MIEVKVRAVSNECQSGVSATPKFLQGLVVLESLRGPVGQLGLRGSEGLKGQRSPKVQDHSEGLNGPGGLVTSFT